MVRVAEMKLKELACAIGFHVYFGSERTRGRLRSETWKFNCQGFKRARTWRRQLLSI